MNMSRDDTNTSAETNRAVLVLSGSTRTGSYNTRLADLVVDDLTGRGVDAGHVNLGDHPLPLFDPDLEAREGPPPEAHALHAKISSADIVIVVSPEYNGAMTPLLKNAVDWVSRVDMATFFTRRVVVMAATPGRRAGASVRDLTTTWLRSIGALVYEETFGLARAGDAFSDGEVDPRRLGELTSFLDDVMSWARTPVE